ncbi:MAG: hypothetical protein QM736_24610 [Vicinamibacterales bacterium]
MAKRRGTQIDPSEDMINVRERLSISPVLWAALISSLSLSNCTNPTQPSSSTASVNTVTITRVDAVTLQPGLRTQFRASITIGSTTTDCTATATWVSGNERVAQPTVSGRGEFEITGVGDGSVKALCDNTTGTFALHVDEPTSWPVSGVVSVAGSGTPVPAATLALDGYAPIQSDATGQFRLVTYDATVRRLLIDAPGFLTRETFLRGGTLRAVDIDVIGSEPVFPMTLFRQTVRNAWEQPARIGITRDSDRSGQRTRASILRDSVAERMRGQERCQRITTWFRRDSAC